MISTSVTKKPPVIELKKFNGQIPYDITYMLSKI